MADEQNPIEKAEEFVKDAPAEAADDILHTAEELEETPAVEAFGEARDALIGAMDEVAPQPGLREMAAPLVGEHYVGDTTVVFGRTVNLPVYTVVFIALGILTITELLLFELPRGFLTIPLMATLAVIKAGLVVWFYMHLNKDSRIFAITLIIPVIMVILATGFLMLVPTGY